MAQCLEDCTENLKLAGSNLAHSDVCEICFRRVSSLGHMSQIRPVLLLLDNSILKQMSSNLGVGVSEGCFILFFVGHLTHLAM